MKRMLVVSLFVSFVSQAVAFYNPGQGRWTSRDPVGERGGANLYAFTGNDLVNRLDILGLALAGTPADNAPTDGDNGCACKCKTVEFEDTPDLTPIVSIDPTKDPNLRILRVGPRFNYTITVEGDPSKCSCSYTDKGSINGSYTLSTPGYPVVTGSGPWPQNKTVPTHGGCVSGFDQPGIEAPMGPLSGSGTYSLIYDLTVTVTCVGADGVKIEDSKTITGGPYKGSIKY